MLAHQHMGLALLDGVPTHHDVSLALLCSEAHAVQGLHVRLTLVFPK